MNYAKNKFLNFVQDKQQTSKNGFLPESFLISHMNYLIVKLEELNAVISILRK